MRKSGYLWILPGLVCIILGVVLYIVGGYIITQAATSEVNFYIGAIIMLGFYGCIFLGVILLIIFFILKRKTE